MVSPRFRGVGKTTICWNLGDALARRNHRVLLVDFDPQCNLSIAVLGENEFVKILPSRNTPMGQPLEPSFSAFYRILVARRSSFIVANILIKTSI
jgi:cellulose biosynthesis protein BcsQ